MIVLSGDIGGTHARMQLTEIASANKMKVVASAHYNNHDHSSFLDIIAVFLVETKVNVNRVVSICFGVAGPVINDKVNVTNLPWVISADEIRNKLKIDNVELINDFTAIGYGLEVLQPQDLCTLQVGKPRESAVKAYIGAGTGLGVGFMTNCPEGYFVHSTEGGHIDFAPTDATQLELLKYLRKKHHRVSFERVLSGQGVVNIYNFVRDNKIFGEEENLELRSLVDGNKNIDVAAAITECAIKHQDVMAMRALDMFIRIYGAAAGNLALTTLPYGGLYIVGGVAPKLLAQIKQGGFLDAFCDKGRMSGLLKEIPLHVVLYEDVGLQGAAVRAGSIAIPNP
ncbi:MAG: Glucokinase [uncultured bacterium]|nr:MAG: Glucokinase [uncultured bacterium]